jgi:hypothetical protein
LFKGKTDFVIKSAAWIIHYSKELWGADAHVFNPDRWLGEDSAAKEKYWMPVSGMNSSVLD